MSRRSPRPRIVPGKFDDDPLYRAKAGLYMLTEQPNPHQVVGSFQATIFDLHKWKRELKSGKLLCELQEYEKGLLKALDELKCMGGSPVEVQEIEIHCDEVECLLGHIEELVGKEACAQTWQPLA